jgi:hypothetical protein
MGQGDPGGQDQAGLGSMVTTRKGELAMSYENRSTQTTVSPGRNA